MAKTITTNWTQGKDVCPLNLDEVSKALACELYDCVNDGGDWNTLHLFIKDFAQVVMRSCGVAVKS